MDGGNYRWTAPRVPVTLSIPHLHLLLNHVPTVGTVVALGLLLLAIIRRNDYVMHASLEVLFLVALVTLPVYLTGVAAEANIESLPGVSTRAIDTHHDAALLAFVCMQATGLMAWIGLWQFKRIARPSAATMGAVLLLCATTLVLMARAATLGGDIRHPEIGAGPTSRSMLAAASITAFVTEYPWVWPTAETLHFVGLCLVVGVVLAVNLRILGVAKAVPFAAFHRLLPWGLLGFGLNFVTGILFFIGSSDQYVQNVAFHWKVLFLGLAGAHFLYLTVFRRIWLLKAGEAARPIDKAAAASGLILWAGIIFWGRMLPFIGNAF